MNKPNRLAYKVLKAKYFQHEDPMKVRHRASLLYLWRNLMASREVVARGWEMALLLMFIRIVGS